MRRTVPNAPGHCPSRNPPAHRRRRPAALQWCRSVADQPRLCPADQRLHLRAGEAHQAAGLGVDRGVVPAERPAPLRHHLLERSREIVGLTERTLHAPRTSVLRAWPLSNLSLSIPSGLPLALGHSTRLQAGRRVRIRRARLFLGSNCASPATSARLPYPAPSPPAPFRPLRAGDSDQPIRAMLPSRTRTLSRSRRRRSHVRSTPPLARFMRGA